VFDYLYFGMEGVGGGRQYFSTHSLTPNGLTEKSDAFSL